MISGMLCTSTKFSACRMQNLHSIRVQSSISWQSKDSGVVLKTPAITPSFRVEASKLVESREGEPDQLLLGLVARARVA